MGLLDKYNESRQKSLQKRLTKKAQKKQSKNNLPKPSNPEDQLLQWKKELETTGVNSAILKIITSKKNHSALTKGVATLGFGLVGYAMTNGTKIKQEERVIGGRLKISSNNLKFTPFAMNQNDIIMPFANIVNVEVLDNGRITLNSMLESVDLQCKFAKELEKIIKEKINKNNSLLVSNADELLKYAELFEKGLLTEEEFNLKKKELL